MESIDIEEMDCDTCLKMQEILRDEIQDTEFLNFAVENISELFGYLATGRVNIRIHRDITDEMWFGVDMKVKLFVLTLVLLAYFKGNTSLNK